MVVGGYVRSQIRHLEVKHQACHEVMSNFEVASSVPMDRNWEDSNMQTARS